ncbi:MAG: response regulator [Treponema sp.]|jgi:CheY-like chemotaxis protein|nr:response regulator [Treponema sp.]
MDNLDEKKKILLVDDDEIEHDIAKNILSDKYEVYTAKSGKEALNYLYNSGFAPSLILLDILMPEMDGWDLFNRIKAISFLKNVPIVFLTSVNKTEGEKRAHDIGADDFITKPYESDKLLDRIEKILEKHNL